MLSRGGVPARLQRLVLCHQEADVIKPDPLDESLCHDQVAVVDRIEGSTEDPDHHLRG